MKISWDKTFMDISKKISERSHCVRFKVGAVIAITEPGKETIITFGYNGPSRGIEHCDEVGCSNRDKAGDKKENGFCRGAHAEINAIINAARNGAVIEDATIYITYSPCMDCAKHILNSGLKQVVYLKHYAEHHPDKRQEADRAIEFLKIKLVCRQYQ